MPLPKEFLNYANANGVISRLPVKFSKKIALAQWASTLFDERRVYSEPEVNELIGQHIADYALIRRMLVNSGDLVRDAYGREYRKVVKDQT